MAKHHKKIERNQHHLLWTRKTWTEGYAQLLRSAFVVDIDWNLHEKLHIAVEPIPVPPQDQLERAWREYQLNKDFIQGLATERKVAWLVSQIDDPAFKTAMRAQFDFLFTH